MIEYYEFPIEYEKDEDGYWIVKCPAFDGCYTSGKTLKEARKSIKEVIQLCLEIGDSPREIVKREKIKVPVSV